VKQRFAKLAKFLPFLPVYGGGKTRLQPVYVGDLARVVEVISRMDPSIESQVSGKIIEAGGPNSEWFPVLQQNLSEFCTVYTFRQLMELVLESTNRCRPIVSFPVVLGYVQGAILERLPLNLFTVTRAQVRRYTIMILSIMISFTVRLNYSRRITS